MSNHLSDAQLVYALQGYCDGLLRDIPPDEVLEKTQSFSPRFERNMAKLIKRQDCPPRSLTHMLAKRTALIALVVTVAFSSLMTVDAIREPIIRFFTEVYETFTRVVFGAEDESAILPTTIEQIYVPEYIPEGFALAEEVADSSFIILTYRNGDDYFDWEQYTADFAYHLDTEGTALEQFEYGGKPYLFYSNKGRQHIVWEHAGYNLICSGTVSKETLLQVVLSIKIEK